MKCTDIPVLNLPGDLKPHTILEYSERNSTCTDYIAPDIITTYDCTIREYLTSQCPSSTSGAGVISGELTNLNKQNILPLFTLMLRLDLRSPSLATIQTGPSGSFVLNNIDACHAHILQFYDNKYMYEYTVRPLKEAQEHLHLTIPIEYPPVGTNDGPRQRSAKPAPAVRLLSTSGVNGNPIIVTVVDNSLRGEGVCAFYTLDGALIRSLPFTCGGAGTYTIPWEGTDAGGHPVPAATYLCRISIGPELVCKTFITR